MRRLYIVSLILLVCGCSAVHVPIDETSGMVRQDGRSQPERSLYFSSKYCRSGLCSSTPVLMMVLGRKAEEESVINASVAQNTKLAGFIFAGATVYDGRLRPEGPKYLSYVDPEGNLVCQGYYSWSGFGSTSDVNLRCFEDSAKVTGKIRTIGRQPKGRFKGKGMGTGLLKFDGGLVAVIYGVDPPDLKEKDFVQLWVLHGGSSGELPVQRNLPKRIQRPPSLKAGRGV